MEKHIYFLSDGSEVADARAMTLDEALAAQQKADEATDGNWIWHGPFTVSGPHSKFPWLVIPAQ